MLDFDIGFQNFYTFFFISFTHLVESIRSKRNEGRLLIPIWGTNTTKCV